MWTATGPAGDGGLLPDRPPEVDRARTLPAISKHIKVLERAGLVRRTQRAQYRPCTLDPARLGEISAWAEQCRATWQARFEQMDDYVAKLQAQGKKDERDD